jgi:hypothetical protein
MRIPLFPDAAKPTRGNPWEALRIILAGAVLAVVFAWLWINPVLQ